MDFKTVDYNARKVKIVRIFASSFILIIGAIILIVWLWPSSPPSMTEILKNATPKGVELTQLTSTSVIKADIAWSPDGNCLAYVKWYNPEIYLINIRQKTESQLTHWNGWGNSGLGLLAYSEDGSALFLGTGGGLWSQPVNGSEPQSLTPNGFPSWFNGYGARFSRDKCALFSGEYPAELHVIDLNTRNQTMLVGGLADSSYATLDISPDGSRVVYSAGIIGQSEPGYPNIPLQHMWVINTDGTGQKQISDTSGGNLRWSPNGSKIAYSYDNKLCQINPDGTNKKESPLQGGSILSFEWSPDGNKIAYWSSYYALWILNLKDGSQKCILNTEDTGVNWKSWNGMAWSPDSKSIAFVLSISWKSALSSTSEENQVFMVTSNNSEGF